MAPIIFLDKDRLKLSSDTNVIKASTYSYMMEAEAALKKARENAAEIIKEAEAIYTAEKKRGYEDGLLKAKQEMAGTIMETAIKTSEYFSAIEKEIVNLVMDIVKKIIYGMNNSDLITGLVQNALSVMRNQKHITLRVNPVHMNHLTGKLSEITSAYPNMNFIDVKSDERLAHGNLILESEAGIIDASITVQLEAIERALSGTLKDIRNNTDNE